MALQFFLNPVVGCKSSENSFAFIEATTYNAMIVSDKLIAFRKQASFWCDITFEVEELQYIKAELEGFIKDQYNNEAYPRKLDASDFLDVLSLYAMVCVAMHVGCSISSRSD